jgi:hypothetical protein
MKINAILNEQQIIKEQILNERTYREFYALGMLLQEYAMTQQQIQQLFQQVADGAARGGNVDKAGDAAVSNRTMLGKGADVAGSVAKAYQGVKEYIGKTGPVKGLDAMIDNAQAQIMKATGGEQGKVSQAIEFYRELSKVPGMAFVVKGIILALAGLAGSGLGPVGIAAGLTFANKMLQGDKFSSAVMSATETGGMVAGIQKAKELLGDTGFDAGQGNDWGDKQTSANGADGPAGSPTTNATQNTPADVPAAQGPNAAGASDGGEYDFAAHSHDYTVKPGDNLSTILDKAKVNPELARHLNPELFGPNGNPNVLQAGQTIRLPDADALKDMQTMIYTGPGNQIGQYHGQYEPGNPDSLDATSIQKQIDAGRYGSDNGMAAQRIAQDAGTSTPSSNANGAGPSLDNMGHPAGATPKGNPIYVKQAPTLAPYDGTIDPKTGYVKGNPWGKPGTRAITSSYKNPNKLIREHAAMYYIDRETTARRWVLNEQLGRARGSYYLTPQGVSAVFKEVEAQYLNEGPMLDKLKSFNQKASSAIGKFTAPIKQAAAAGWDSATNKITARDLDMNWRRSAKLDKEASVDSAKVVEFLKKQGVKNGLIDSAFAQAGLQSPSGEQQQGQMTQQDTQQGTQLGQQGAQLGQQGMPIDQTSSNTQNIQSIQQKQATQSSTASQPRQNNDSNVVADVLKGAQDAWERGAAGTGGAWGSVADQGNRGASANSLSFKDEQGRAQKYFKQGNSWIDQKTGKAVTDPTIKAMLNAHAATQSAPGISNTGQATNPRNTGQATTGQTAQITKTNATQPQNVNPGQVPNYANPQSQEYVARREASRRMSAAQQTTQSTTPNFGGQQQSAKPSSVNYNLPSTPTDTTTAKTRTGGKVPGQVSQTPNAIRKRAARAGATPTTNAPSAFGDMATRLAARPTTSSTGGTTTGVAGVGNGVVSHTANPNNPNQQPTTAPATPTTAPTPADRDIKNRRDARDAITKANQQPTNTPADRDIKNRRDARDAITKANQPNQQTKPWKGPEFPAKKVVDKETVVPVESVGESRVDFGAMLFNRMKSGQ